MQKSVPGTSLSIVFGMPTTLTPALWSFAATLSVSSPPMAMRPSILCRRRFSMTIVMSLSLRPGFVREVPSIVPLSCRMSRTSMGSQEMHLAFAEQAGPSVVDAPDLVIHCPAPLGYGANGGIETGAIASACQYSDTQFGTSSSGK